MSITQIRQQLHTYIDSLNESKLKDVKTFIEQDMEYEFSDEEIAILHERLENYNEGRTKVYTIGEAHNMIINKKAHDI